MKVIITGASGFIGKNLLLGLPKDWETVVIYNQNKDFPDFVRRTKSLLDNVTAVRCDLTDQQAVKRVAKKVGTDFDVCIYLAANGDPTLSVERPAYDLQTNTIGLINFVEHFNVKRFIYMSSGAVYDGLTGSVSPEIAVQPKLPYGISKLASEQYIRFFTDKLSFIEEYIILRFFGAYGPYEPARKIYTRLVEAFCFENRTEFTIRGNGQNYIDAMYIDDAVDRLLRIAQSDLKNTTLDFCRGWSITIDALVKTAAAAFGKTDIQIDHIGKTEEHIQFEASPVFLNQFFNFKPIIGLTEGLQRFHNHLANMEARKD